MKTCAWNVHVARICTNAFVGPNVDRVQLIFGSELEHITICQLGNICPTKVVGNRIGLEVNIIINNGFDLLLEKLCVTVMYIFLISLV